MKAIQLDAFGGPEVLHVAEVPEPHAGRGQVRVQLRAVGVNPFEAKVRSGAIEQLFKTPLPAILGNEISGVVDEVGDGISGLAKRNAGFGWSDTGAYAQLALATVVAPPPHG